MPKDSKLDHLHVSFQNVADDTNLDGYSENEVRTRSSSEINQVWQMTYVETHNGEDVYTITMIDPTNPNFKGKNLEATTEDGTVGLAAHDKNKLSQRWLLRFQEDHTVILSMKYLDYVLTAMGVDKAVLLQRNDASNKDRAQKWTRYNKNASFGTSEDSWYRMETGV